MTDVLYNISTEDGVVIAPNHTIILPPWAGIESNAENVAAEICEVHLDELVWAEFFFDSSRENVVVEILKPEEVAGRYRVDVMLKPKATATRIPNATASSPAKA